jgi:ABC-type lipoprotein export system ATPase subunit
MTGTFILTFFDGAPATETTESRGQTVRHSFIKEKKRLERLTEVTKRSKDQLICLLHGPGGSGKTAVIDLLMEYAREYCSYLDNF